MHPIVIHHGYKRTARGFSCAEIVLAELTCDQFAKLGLSCDPRRRSNHAENVAFLKTQKLVKK